MKKLDTSLYSYIYFKGDAFHNLTSTGGFVKPKVRRLQFICFDINLTRLDDCITRYYENTL